MAFARSVPSLPRPLRFTTVPRLFDGDGFVKDMIEATGVQHTEGDLVTPNGEPVNRAWSYRNSRDEK